MKTIISIIILLLVAGGVIFAMQSSKAKQMAEKQAMMIQAETDQKMMNEKMMNEKMIMEKEVMIDTDTMKTGETMDTKDSMTKDTMKTDEKTMTDKAEAMAKMGSYEAYSADKIARAGAGDVVLFFHASWCPSCRGLDTNIEKNIKSIPAGVSILKVDYDTQPELKKKYGVTYQHTLVQVDKNGNMIKKWSGGSSLDNLLSQIQ